MVTIRLTRRGARNQPFYHVVVTEDRKSTRLNSSHSQISYAVFCLKKKNKHNRKRIRLRRRAVQENRTPEKTSSQLLTDATAFSIEDIRTGQKLFLEICSCNARSHM